MSTPSSLARELELGADFGAVHLPLGDEPAVVPGRPTTSDAKPSPSRAASAGAKPIPLTVNPREDDGRLLRCHERLRGGDIGVGRELALVDRDGDDLVDARSVRLICDGPRVPTDDADDHRAPRAPTRR